MNNYNRYSFELAPKISGEGFSTHLEVNHLVARDISRRLGGPFARYDAGPLGLEMLISDYIRAFCHDR